jgi:hypothetical protein
MRTRIMNQLQALAMNEGYRWKKKLFSEQGRALLEKLSLAPWASRRRQELLELLDRMNPTIGECCASCWVHLGDVPAQEHCQGSDGTQTGGSVVLDVEAAQAAARINPDWRRPYMCGGMVMRIRRRSSSVRTRDSSESDMV